MEEETSAPLIRDMFDTARIMACCRAIESERKKGRFRDPYARLLAGERGIEIVRGLPGGKEKTWPVVLRTCVYDEIILRLVEQKKINTIINLAAGLDTRPYRLPLPSDLYWIEIDLPHVLAYKTELLADAQPVCKLEHVPLDITDNAARQAFLAQIDVEGKQALVICEGLLIYLTEQQVSSLATDLHAYTFIRWWLAEFVTPRMLLQDEQGWNTYTSEDVRAHFSLPTKTDFFQLLGWNVIEFRSMIAEALRLRLPIERAWLLRLMARISPPQPGEDPYNIGAFILLENKPSGQKRAAHLGSRLRRARNVKR